MCQGVPCLGSPIMGRLQDSRLASPPLVIGEGQQDQEAPLRLIHKKCKGCEEPCPPAPAAVHSAPRNWLWGTTSLVMLRLRPSYCVTWGSQNPFPGAWHQGSRAASPSSSSGVC